MKNKVTVHRIVPNILSNDLTESKRFYNEFLNMELVMDLGWILTFKSSENETAQISIVKSNDSLDKDANTTFISIEVSEVDTVYKKALAMKYEITYPITNEDWGVRRFFVKDPNGAVLNILSHL